MATTIENSLVLDRLSPPLERDAERQACVRVEPGFHIRQPPAPHLLSSYITPDSQLFETIHMGSAVVDTSRWRLVVSGLVENPFTISYDQLLQLPRKSITTFHECYGSPIAPPTKALWRIGNVKWTGVPLNTLLERAKPLPNARFVWSEGLDSGSFANVSADRYQKDLPLSKAMSPECLVAWEINGERLRKERGAPVRLVVPGWFGTNSTKWLCRLELREDRAQSPYTTRWYNEVDPTRDDGRMRPVWQVEVNSMIVQPAPGEVTVAKGGTVQITGWAWSWDGVQRVDVSGDGGTSWTEAELEQRSEVSWQRFKLNLKLDPGERRLVARATSVEGLQQPFSGRRNHVHSVDIQVRENGNL